MAKINEQAYETMIAALYAFASKVYVSASEMQTLASVCTQAIGEGDKANQEIYGRVRDCTLRYAECTDVAKHIAEQMQFELDRQREEDQVWGDDGGDA